MPRKGNIIPKAPLGRIAKSVGAKRLSDEALEIFSHSIEDYANSIAKHALSIAKHSGRKTILEKDIKLAIK